MLYSRAFVRARISPRRHCALGAGFLFVFAIGKQLAGITVLSATCGLAAIADRHYNCNIYHLLSRSQGDNLLVALTLQQ